MIQSLFNWRSLLAVIAIGIVSGTIFYSQYLSKKIASDEKRKVNTWFEAQRTIVNANDQTSLNLASIISSENKDIPIIETTENDSIVSFINLDSTKAANDKTYLPEKLKKFKAENQALEIKLSSNPYIANRYYYGHTVLLDEVRYYPLIQLFIVLLFIFFIFYSITVRNRATQNQLWTGMAKETAHQLGTPVSSLEGWIEMLKETNVDAKTISEIQKDVNRLKLVSDRFGKIGSKPKLEEKDLVAQVFNMMEYIKKRAAGKVQFAMNTHGNTEIFAMISSPLFDWVIENLLKNALDAMDGKGQINIDMQQHEKEIFIDISDSGKGIAKGNLQKVFKPGFTTKKRGWGLGLSLSKRIIDQYHKGQLIVKESDIGKGTTFRIMLRKFN
jgi:signal transduction histidine kinase